MNEPVRTLFITHAAAMGGAERSLLEILTHADRARITPALCTLAPGPLADAARAARVPVHVLHAPPHVIGMKRDTLGPSPAALATGLRLAAASQPVIRDIARLARRERAHVIYTNSAKAHVLGGAAGRLARIPVIWHMRDAFSKKATRSFFQLTARALARTVIGNSSFTAAPFRAHPDCRAVLNGLPTDTVRAARATPDVRAEFGLQPGHLVAGTAGRLDHWKGIPTFLDAAATVARNMPQARFLVVGDTLYHHAEFRTALEKRAAQPDLRGRVTFTGFREDVYDLIAAMDVYVHPSDLPEPFGRGIVEAMLLQRPVIASRHGGPLEIVRPGHTGLLFDPGNPADLAQAMESLFRDPARCAAMGDAGRTHALENFSMERMLAQLTEIIQQTAE